MIEPTKLLEALVPLTEAIATLDLGRPEEAVKALNEALPEDERSRLEKLLIQAQEAGWLTPREGSPKGVWFGRLAKASEATSGLTIDAVEMEGEAAEHTHPQGEVSFCVARSGKPLFDGQPPGWVVLPPGSHHTPTVTGGRMLIVYFLPDGAVVWGPKREEGAEA